MTVKEIKRQIRKLNKLKKKCGVYSPERKEILAKIRELKRQLIDLLEIDEEKKPIIKEILQYQKYSCFDEVFYNKHNVKDLKIHLEKLKRRRQDEKNI